MAGLNSYPEELSMIKSWVPLLRDEGWTVAEVTAAGRAALMDGSAPKSRHGHLSAISERLRGMRPPVPIRSAAFAGDSVHCCSHCHGSGWAMVLDMDSKGTAPSILGMQPRMVAVTCRCGVGKVLAVQCKGARGRRRAVLSLDEWDEAHPGWREELEHRLQLFRKRELMEARAVGRDKVLGAPRVFREALDRLRDTKDGE